MRGILKGLENGPFFSLLFRTVDSEFSDSTPKNHRLFSEAAGYEVYHSAASRPAAAFHAAALKRSICFFSTMVAIMCAAE